MSDIEQRLNELAEKQVISKMAIQSMSMMNIANRPIDDVIKLNQQMLCEQSNLNRIEGEISALLRYRHKEAERTVIND